MNISSFNVTFPYCAQLLQDRGRSCAVEELLMCVCVCVCVCVSSTAVIPSTVSPIPSEDTILVIHDTIKTSRLSIFGNNSIQHSIP